jgi:glucose/arabinose dehydrogenase
MKLTGIKMHQEIGMNSIDKVPRFRASVGLTVVALIAGFGIALPTGADSLYVGDGSDNTIKRFDADTGVFQGAFVKKGNSPIKGPRGIIFDLDGDLLVSNQNAGANKSGEILEHDGLTGAFLGALVSHNDPNAPFAPRGIALENDVLFVADTSAAGKNNPPGRLLAYTKDGVLLADLTPDHNTEFPGALSTSEFHPRGVVVGPDGLLYVSVSDDLEPTSANYDKLSGWILRFDAADGGFVDVFASNEGTGCAEHLHRPEGLVFGPDGKLYVTAFQGDAPAPGSTDTDKILIFDDAGTCVGQVDLDQSNQPRTYAQAILFGPDDCLYAPMNNTGEVRRYNVGVATCDADLPYESFVAAGGALKVPWYLTFGATDPGTLEYPPAP